MRAHRIQNAARRLISRRIVAAILTGIMLGQPPRTHGGEDDSLSPWQKQQKSALPSNLKRPEFDALRKMQRAESFALGLSTSAKAYVMTSEPTQVSTEIAHALTQLLLKPGSLELSTSLCMFEPAIGFRFYQVRESVWLPQETVDVQVCFKCRELSFQTADDHYGPFVLNPKFIYSFESVRDRLLELSQNARPSDSLRGKIQRMWDAQEEQTRRFNMKRRGQ